MSIRSEHGHWKELTIMIKTQMKQSGVPSADKRQGMSPFGAAQVK